MSILSDVEITELNKFKKMITPYVDKQVRKINDRRVISYGTSSFGYDVKLASKDLKLFTNVNNALIDPKKLDSECLVDAKVVEDKGDKYFILPPNSYALGHTEEYFKIPRDVTVIAVGKSTYARAGCIINVTPIEAGFEGVVVIEIANSTNLPMKVYLEEGIAQFLFFQGNKECSVSYADRSGKYQGQRSTVLSKV